MPIPREIQAETPACIMCKERSYVTLSMREYRALQDHHIQDALPTRDADFRELVLSGTHSECWDKLFEEPEDEDQE